MIKIYFWDVASGLKVDDYFSIEEIRKEDVSLVALQYTSPLSQSVNQRLHFSPKEFIQDWFLNENMTKTEFLNMINNIIQPV